MAKQLAAKFRAEDRSFGPVFTQEENVNTLTEDEV